MYRPPSSPLSDFDDSITKTREFILSLPAPLPNIILLGEFNMPEVIWDNPHAYNPSSELLIAIEQHPIKEQAGFGSGKSCTSQLLNLTHHIEDVYEEGMITGTDFVELSAAYDTVNHRLLIQKLYNTTLDSQLCRVIQNLLSDRIFYVELKNERSRWRIQKNGLP